MCLYSRLINSNIDIRRQLKKMLNNTKTSSSRRVCLPIKTIYDAIYLDKWNSLSTLGQRCPHKQLVPSFWDVYYRGPNETSNKLYLNNQTNQEVDNNWIEIRQSFYPNFEFSLVNSCLLGIHKKSSHSIKN